MKILVEFFLFIIYSFYFFHQVYNMDLTCGSVHNLAKTERNEYFPSTDRTSLLIKSFIIMALFRMSCDRVVHFVGETGRLK